MDATNHKPLIVRYQRSGSLEESYSILMPMVIVVKKARQARRIEQHRVSRLKILVVFARQVLIYLFVVSRARIPTADRSGVTQ